MKQLISLLFACAGLIPAVSAQPLVCTEPGTVLEYAEYDAAGKLTGYNQVTVVSCERNPSGALVVTNSERTLDARHDPVEGELVGEHTERIVVREDAMLLSFGDLVSELSAGAGSDVTLSGDEYAIPFDLEAGQELPDAKMFLTLAQGRRKLKISLDFRERSVLARERMTTPAGEFDTYKISEKLTARVMIFKMSTRHVAWYAPGVGLVREEELSKKGKRESYSELIALRRPARTGVDPH